jgi:hypothetical protein
MHGKGKISLGEILPDFLDFLFHQHSVSRNF